MGHVITTVDIFGYAWTVAIEDVTEAVGEKPRGEEALIFGRLPPRVEPRYFTCYVYAKFCVRCGSNDKMKM